MKLAVREEPLLEFAGNARHVDPRHGIADYGPIDATSTALRTIRAGIVGTPASVQGLRSWLDRCRLPIEAKDSRLGHLFVPFPGFDASAVFRSTLVRDSRLERHIRDRDIKRLADPKPQDAVHAAVELYAAELELLDEEPGCNIVIIARPETLPEKAEPEVDPSSQHMADDFVLSSCPDWANHRRRGGVSTNSAPGSDTTGNDKQWSALSYGAAPRSPMTDGTAPTGTEQGNAS